MAGPGPDHTPETVGNGRTGRRASRAGIRTGPQWGRLVLLAALCALVYYISYDHGQASLRPRLEERERQALEERDRLVGEIIRLQAQLSRCLGGPGEPEQADTARIPLKVNQSKTLFDGRLVLSVPALDSEAGWARVRVNLVNEDILLTEDLAVGGSLRFSLGGRDWAVVAAGLTLTTVNLNLMEIKKER